MFPVFLLCVRFLLLSHVPHLAEAYLSSDSKSKLLGDTPPEGLAAGDGSGLKRKQEEADQPAADGEGAQPPSKKMLKLKGRNKQRPVTFRVENSKKMCPAYLAERECVFGDKCKFLHDTAAFMKDKPEDIGPECYNFKTFGKCPYGFACRFATQHLTPDFKNITDQELFDRTASQPQVHNTLTKELQHLLWKKKYDFSTANSIVDSYYDKRREEQGGYTNRNQPSSRGRMYAGDASSYGGKPVGCVVDAEEISLRPREKKIVRFSFCFVH